MLVILLLWHQSRKRFAGTGYWVLDFGFQAGAVFLLILRGNIPDWMSMVLSNTLVMAGAILGYTGLGRFIGKRISQVHNYALLAAFACVHAYFTLVQPNLAARTLNLAVGLLIICFQCMWFLIRRIESGMRRLTLGAGVVFGAYCLVSIVRIVEFITGALTANDFFQSGAFESFILISYQVLFILLTYSLVLMVNKRLFSEVKTQEEKFARAFHSSPYAITLTRLSNGQIIEVNDGFLGITGYQYAEAVGKTTVDLHLWDGEEDRAVIMDELSRSGKVQGREIRFRRKSGEMITGLFSADIIPIGNEKFILSSIADITERKRMEEQLRQAEEESRLLIKYAPSMLYEIDFHGPAFKSVNDAMCQFLGYTREELLAMNPFDLLDEEGKAIFRERIRRKLAGEAISDSVEYKSRTKDGREVYGILNTTFTYKDGKPKGAIVVAHDITERKHAEEALKKAHDELEKRVQERTSELSEAFQMLRIENIQRKQLEDTLRESENRVRFFASQCLTAQETERKRVAGELHDSIAASLGAMKFKIETIAEEMKQGHGSPESLRNLGSRVTDINNEVRRIMADLRPSILDDLGIVAAMNWFCREYQRTYSHISMENQIGISEHEVPDSLKTPIFRISQEAMNNISKYSKASLVNLSLLKEDGKILLTIQDNGQGFDLNAVRKGMGLSTMRERAQLSGGSFSLESDMGKGTIIHVSWPLIVSP